jgi:hypothetical protein
MYAQGAEQLFARQKRVRKCGGGALGSPPLGLTTSPSPGGGRTHLVHSRSLAAAVVSCVESARQEMAMRHERRGAGCGSEQPAAQGSAVATQRWAGRSGHKLGKEQRAHLASPTGSATSATSAVGGATWHCQQRSPPPGTERAATGGVPFSRPACGAASALFVYSMELRRRMDGPSRLPWSSKAAACAAVLALLCAGAAAQGVKPVSRDVKPKGGCAHLVFQARQAGTDTGLTLHQRRPTPTSPSPWSTPWAHRRRSNRQAPSPRGRISTRAARCVRCHWLSQAPLLSWALPFLSPVAGHTTRGLSS